MLSTNINIKIYRTKIAPVLYGIRILEVKYWKKVALDRDEESQGPPRAVEPMMMMMMFCMGVKLGRRR